MGEADVGPRTRTATALFSLATLLPGAELENSF